MNIGMIIALVVIIPVILFPAAFVWYMNISGLYQVMKESRQREKRRAAQRTEA